MGYPMNMGSLPPADDFHSVVDPMLLGVTTPEVVLDGESAAGTDYVPQYVLATVNPGDDVAGATRLMSGTPEVYMVQPLDTIEISSLTPITDLYVVGVLVGAAGAAIDIDTFTDYSAVIGRGDTDIADWLAQAKHLTFLETDNVRQVRLTLTGAVDTNVKILKVQGVSYA